MANPGPRTVIVDKLGVVHDLGTTHRCAVITKLRKEFRDGVERYVVVKGVQIIAYSLPGCTSCYGTQAAFREYVTIT